MISLILDSILAIELVVVVLVSVAYLTLLERKALGRMQRRVGPNVIGYMGLLQPFADGLKLFRKENLLPFKIDTAPFIISAIYFLSLSLVIWIVIPFNFTLKPLLDIPLAIMFVLAISTLGIYGILFSGWSSNSRYGVIGSLRSTSQLISYEVYIGLLLMSVFSLSNSQRFNDILLGQIFNYYVFILFPLLFIFFIAILGETSRSPFDLTEAESELVSGAITEFSGFLFSAFYIAEYGFITFMSYLCSLLFLGGHGFILFAFAFILVRATLPRIRLDQLISLGWSALLVLVVSYLILVISYIWIL